VLPNQRYQLDQVETKMAENSNMNQMFTEVDNETPRKVEIKLPKFKLEQSLSLSDHFQKLGMTDMFSENAADFSRLSANNGLFVRAVLQKAFLEVNEEGSEAAAATGVVIVERSMPMPPPVFNCDQPFMFFIKDKKTDMVLFSGRVITPHSDPGNDHYGRGLLACCRSCFLF